MASYTTNLNLKKPAGSENVAIGDINNNMDAIDQAYGTLNTKTAAVTKKGSMDGGTTDSNGNLALGISASSAIVVSAYGEFVYIPFTYQGNWYIKAISSDANNTAKTNTTLSTVYYIYIEQ